MVDFGADFWATFCDDAQAGNWEFCSIIWANLWSDLRSDFGSLCLDLIEMALGASFRVDIGALSQKK